MKLDEITHRFYEAYLQMARVARYRPGAPSDGFGSIQLSDDELNDPDRLSDEAVAFAKRLKLEDDDGKFTLYGCTDFAHNRLLVYLLSAASLCFGGAGVLPVIKKLLKLALAEVDEIDKYTKRRAS